MDNYEKKNKKCLRLAYASYIKMYVKNISDWDGSEETKPRELLQTLGTDIIRKNIDDNFFVNRICDDIRVYSYFFDVLVISDARIKNEILIPEKEFDNVIKINITRPDSKNKLSSSEQKHITETGLDDYDDYDYRIINDSTLEDLKTKIDEIIEVIEDEH